MADDVLVNKAATIERCVARARAEFAASADFATDFTRQDAAVLNVLRACEAAMDMANFLIRRERLGPPQSARDAFDLLAAANWIEADMARKMKSMIGYRNIALHDYNALLLEITIAVVSGHIDDFIEFTSTILKKNTK